MGFRSWLIRKLGGEPAAEQTEARQLPVEPEVQPQQKAETVAHTRPTVRAPVGVTERRSPEFDTFIREKAEAFEGKWAMARIAGTAFANPDGSSRQDRVLALEPFAELKLSAEPDNAFDRHAVQVFAQDGFQLGYVPRSLAPAVSDALLSGGEACAYVRAVNRSERGDWGAAIDLMWRAKPSPRTEFRRMLDSHAQVEEWFWAKLSGCDKRNAGGILRQHVISQLQPKDSPQVRVPDGNAAADQATKVFLQTTAGDIFAELGKSHAERVLLGLRDGRRWGAMVYEVRERSGGKGGLEPVVAILLFTEEFSASIRQMEDANP